VRQPIGPEALAARELLERRLEEFKDLRTAAEIRLRRGDRLQRLTGVLLLRAPAALRLEALSPLGTPALVIAVDDKSLTVWEVLDDRAYVLPATPEANRRWLGLSLGDDELVALLSGRVVPLRDPLSAELLPDDGGGASLVLKGSDRTQRIWFDPANGQAKAVEWTGGSNPARVVFPDIAPDSPPAGMTLTTSDGKLEVFARYQNPRMNTGFDPDLVRVTVPERVRIQEFR